MRQGIHKEIDWEYMGALLASDDDVNQIKFFKGFIRECKTWGTHYQIEIQLAGVNQKLTDEEKDLLSMIGYKEK
jgi:hypothetical protein